MYVPNRQTYQKITALLFFLIIGLASLHQPVHAVSENSTVTARVVNNDNPTTPVLVAPANSSTLTINKPSFIWQRSTDDNGIAKYQLWLDGSLHFDNIPITSTDTSSYTSTYDAGTLRFTLTPKTGLAEGAHTWKIRAVDSLGATTDSATWSFTIDTLAPSFILTNIGDAIVSISAQDAGTIPSSPVELQNNEPLLSGTGEANSTVQLTLTIPGDPTQNFSTAITSGGVYSLQLGLLPRGVVMTLSFVITDQAGNVSVLSGVEFIIADTVIVIPPPTSPSPTPGVTPSPIPETSPTPTPEPLLVIPVISPRETLNEIIQETYEALPDAVKNILANTPKEVGVFVAETGKALAPISAAAAATAVPATSFLVVASQFGGNLSFNMIIRLLQALGLLPSGKPQGLVFNSATSDPIPFALLTITNTNQDQVSITETVVSDSSGVYRGVRLPLGEFKILASHQEFTFPTSLPRPSYVSMADFYKGENFQVQSEENLQLFLIPLDPKKEETELKQKTRLRLRLNGVNKITRQLLYPLFVISGLLAVLFPTWANIGMFGIYAVVIANKARQWFRVPTIAGTIIDAAGAPLENVVVRLSDPETNQLVSVLTTKADGSFSVFGLRGLYQLSITKPNYVWEQAGEVAMSLYQVDTRQASQSLVLTMKSAGDYYQQMFA